MGRRRARLLGPDGSGKSTTIRVLLGVLRSDAGTAQLLGGDPWRDAVELHRRLAYVTGDVIRWPVVLFLLAGHLTVVVPVASRQRDLPTA